MVMINLRYGNQLSKPLTHLLIKPINIDKSISLLWRPVVPFTNMV